MKILFTIVLLIACASFADDIKTTDGTVYKNATMTGHDAVGINIVYDDGVARIRFSQLSDEMQKKYGYDPAKAEEQARQEQYAAALRSDQVKLAELEAKKKAADWTAHQALLDSAKPIYMEVMQICADGLLLNSGPDSVCLLRGFPGQSKLVDHDVIKCMAAPDGVFKYTNTLGAEQSVRAWIYVGEIEMKPKVSHPGTLLDAAPHRN